MLSITPIGSASEAARYYGGGERGKNVDAAKGASEYYGNAVGEWSKPAVWHGAAARALGIEGREASAREIERAFKGYDPVKNVPLVQNAGKEDRRCGYDFTFSVPKDFSIAWAAALKAGDDELASKIEDAVQESALAATEAVIKEHIVSRTGKGGENHVGGEPLYFAKLEATNRNGDPQLHVHVGIINTALREDGSWGALEAKEAFIYKKAIGADFRGELAERLKETLALQRDREFVGVRGVEDPERRALSSRTQEKLEFLRQHGLHGAKAAELAVLATRQNKKRIQRRRRVVGAGYSPRGPEFVTG